MLRPSFAAWVSAAAALLIAPTAWAAPPTAPTSAAASAPAQGNDVAVTFSAAEGERFQLHRGTSPDFTPSATTRVRACFASPCQDAPAAPGTYTYKVIAEGASGEQSAATAAAPLDVSFDPAQLPALTLATPATVSGTITIDVPAGTDLTLDDRPIAAGWNTRTSSNGAHTITARRTAGGLVSTVTRAVTVNNSRASSLVAAYGFDVPSTTSVPDNSGNGHDGTLQGGPGFGLGIVSSGAWRTSLRLDGIDDNVELPSLGNFAQTAFTLSAQVRHTPSTDRTLVGSWADGVGGPMVWTSTFAPGGWALTTRWSSASYLITGVAAKTSWQHVAATYDGERARFYIDGVKVAERLYSGPIGASDDWRIGAYGTPAAGFLQGSVDDVRIYRRALNADEIATDRTEDVLTPGAPPAPTGLTTLAGSSKVTLAWNPSAGATKYNVHRLKTASDAPSDANRVGQVDATSTQTFVDRLVPAGSVSYVVTAENATARSAGAIVRTVTMGADTSKPFVTFAAPPKCANLAGTVVLSGQIQDNVEIATAQFRVDGVPVGTPIAVNSSQTDVSYVWDSSTVANGTHTIWLSATDWTGNVGNGNSYPCTVTNTAAEPVSGLVARYTFDETTGETAEDASGLGRHGTIVGATRTAAGRTGGGLVLNGGSDRVDLPALGSFAHDGFTLEAWIKAVPGQRDGGIVGSWVYGSGGGPMLWVDHVHGRLHAITGANPGDYLDSGRTPGDAWQHVAATYDGTKLTYFIDGDYVGERALSRDRIGASNTWRIGAYGNPAANAFAGTVDDVRIYSRARTQAELRSDMGDPPGPVDTTAPSAPSGLNVAATTPNSLELGWLASSDDRGVVAYSVFRDGTEVSTTSTPGITFEGLVCGREYVLGVVARDAAGNRSARTSLTASTSACPAQTGLVAAYGFEEAAGNVIDTSGNGRHGIPTNIGRSDSGHTGRALQLAGGSNGRVDLGRLGLFYRQAVTLEAWIKPTANGFNNDAGIVGTWDYSQGGGTMLWHFQGQYRMALGTGLSNYLSAPTGTTVGEWQHIASTYDGTTARFYRDGVEVASRIYTGDVGSSDLWRIGAYSNSPYGTPDGLIDDVRIYSRALSPQQIAADMAAPVVPAGV